MKHDSGLVELISVVLVLALHAWLALS